MKRQRDYILASGVFIKLLVGLGHQCVAQGYVTYTDAHM